MCAEGIAGVVLAIVGKKFLRRGIVGVVCVRKKIDNFAMIIGLTFLILRKN